MISILVWLDGTRTEMDIRPGREAVVHRDGEARAFVRTGVERSMFVYTEVDGAPRLRAVDLENVS